MSARDIYNKLVSAGLTPAGACGLMGNLKAESDLKANIAQRGMTGLSDDEYTYLVDCGSNGKYTAGSMEYNFFYDSVGYGLAQWTFWTRKQGLYNYAKSKGVSIGNEAMQIEYLLEEMKSQYIKVLNTLKNPEASVYDCANIVCTDFERPAFNNVAVRAKYADEFYKQFAKTAVDATLNGEKISESDGGNADQSIMTLQAVMRWNGYWDKDCDGIYTTEFADKLVEFAGDIKGQGG